MPQSQEQPYVAEPPLQARTPLVTESDLINPSLTIAGVMTVAPRTCSPASTVIEAVMIFRDADCGMVPITDAGHPATCGYR